MEIMQCPICHNHKLKVIYEAKRFPYVGFAVLKREKEELFNDYPKERLFSRLKVMDCQRCNHAFQAISPNEALMDKIYSKYYNYPSPMLSGFTQERENIFLNYFSRKVSPICKEKKLERVLEIACFDGFVLNGLAKKGYMVCGCDPSKGADIANSFGIKVHKRYFEASDFIKQNELFDIVIFRHFIEHVHSPVALLREAEKVLTKEGLIVFETPNVEYYLENGSFETFNLQHLQNFSIYSLGVAVKKASLGIIDYMSTPENLIVVVSRDKRDNSVKTDLWQERTKSFSDNFRANTDYLHKRLKPYLEQKKKIILWGAGGFCGDFFSLYRVEAKDIAFVVDKDSRKWEMCFVDNNLKILSPDKLLSEKVDLIIITSMYSSQIIKQIKELNIGADIINLHPQVEYISSEKFSEVDI